MHFKFLEDLQEKKNENEEENKIDLNETQKKVGNKIKLTVSNSKQDNEISDKKSKNGETVIKSMATNSNIMEDSANKLIGNDNDVDNKEVIQYNNYRFRKKYLF